MDRGLSNAGRAPVGLVERRTLLEEADDALLKAEIDKIMDKVDKVIRNIEELGLGGEVGEPGKGTQEKR